MFDIGSSELLLILVVAIVVIGPKDLPRALYKVGQVIGKAKGMARHFRIGVDAMIREAELEELQKQWAKENERIMAESALPDLTNLGGTMKPLAGESAHAAADQLPAEQSDAVPPPFQTDPGPQLEPEPEPETQPRSDPKPRPKPKPPTKSSQQSTLPLDAPQGDEAKGSSAA